MKKKFFLAGLITLTLMSGSVLNAQVSIGTDEVPVAGALLQLKDVAGVADDGANAHKGMAYPRVSLSDYDNLFPMFLSDPNNPASGANAEYAAGKAALDASHTGLTVYNTNDAAPLMKGLYTWTGSKWMLAGNVEGDDEANQFMQWDGDKWVLTSVTDVNPVNRLIIPLDSIQITTESWMYNGTIRFSVPDAALDDFSILSIIPIVESSDQAGISSDFVAKNLTLATAVRRDADDTSVVRWKLRVTNDNQYDDGNEFAKIDAIYVNYTTSGGEFAEDGTITKRPIDGF